MVIDFHSHILPRIDDGSSSVEESLTMLRVSREQGIGEVILTPHFYPQHSNPMHFLEKRSRSFRKLTEAMNPNEALPAIRLGAEVYFYPHMSHSDDLRALQIEGTSCILVEMPMGPWTDRMYRELEGIYTNLGLTPIVAHVDRYLGRFRDYGIPERLADLPVLVQANASFFLRGGKGVSMLREKQIHVLGSDCHNTADRAPNLGEAVRRIERKLGAEALTWIKTNEQMVFGTAGK